jgi:hypothetical protein
MIKLPNSVTVNVTAHTDDKRLEWAGEIQAVLTRLCGGTSTIEGVGTSENPKTGEIEIEPVTKVQVYTTFTVTNLLQAIWSTLQAYLVDADQWGLLIEANGRGLLFDTDEVVSTDTVNVSLK